jgi:hypothetical protein
MARIAGRLAQRWYHHSSFWLTFLIPVAVILTSCGKQADSGGSESSPVQTSDSAPNPTPRAATPTTDVPTAPTPKASVMIITYQTQSTPNQNTFPPGMRMGATRGEEIRYLDLANNKMRLEKYVFGNSGKKLYQTMIIDQTGSYRFEPGKNEAFFTPMTTPVPVWNFDQNVNTKWARERQLTVKPGQWLNRTCDVVSVGSGNNVWLWNEIPLKKEQKLVGSEIVIDAYRIQENASIDASMLQLPAEMKIRSATGTNIINRQ